jgi:hypothetical protein
MNNYQAGELIIVGGNYGNEIGFYRGLGSNTIQYYTPLAITHCVPKGNKPWTSYIGGQYKNSRVARYHPDLVTDPKEKEELEQALEIIRENNILPVKY